VNLFTHSSGAVSSSVKIDGWRWTEVFSITYDPNQGWRHYLLGGYGEMSRISEEDAELYKAKMACPVFRWNNA